LIDNGAGLPLESFAALRDALNRGRALSRDRGLARVARAFDAAARHLSRPMRLVVMGEENSGKSSLINMLMRESVVPAGSLAGVRARLLVRYGPETALHAVGADGSRARLTTKALARMAVPEPRPAPSSTSIIYNASDLVRREGRADPRRIGLLPGAPPPPAHSAAKFIDITLPREFLRRVELLESRLYPEEAEKKPLGAALRPMDLAIWCTLATQAWKETERQAWRRMPASLARNAVLVVTYKDALHKARDEEKLIARLRREAGPLFKDILLLSPRQALDAMSPLGEIADTVKWERCGAAIFEAALAARLGAFNRRRIEKGAALLHRLAAQAVRHGRHGLPAALSDTIALHFGQLLQDVGKRLAPDASGPGA
jgi:hypothetical protein